MTRKACGSEVVKRMGKAGQGVSQLEMAVAGLAAGLAMGQSRGFGHHGGCWRPGQAGQGREETLCPQDSLFSSSSILERPPETLERMKCVTYSYGCSKHQECQEKLELI